MNSIRGKVALITGGSQGLSAAIARTFADAGATGIIIVGRDTEKGKLVATLTSSMFAPLDPHHATLDRH